MKRTFLESGCSADAKNGNFFEIWSKNNLDPNFQNFVYTFEALI